MASQAFRVRSLQRPRKAPVLPLLKVVVTGGLRGYNRKIGQYNFLARMAPHGLAARHLVRGHNVIVLRRALITDYQSGGVVLHGW